MWKKMIKKKKPINAGTSFRNAFRINSGEFKKQLLLSMLNEVDRQILCQNVQRPLPPPPPQAYLAYQHAT